jgi:acyl-coenzyme A thioesterase PaaI-like protein
MTAMQDLVKVHCYGCGALNAQGLQIKSFWAGDEVVCAWRPRPEHIGHPGVLYGGLIASVLDCHCIWTAAAHAYRRTGREMSGSFDFQYVTAALRIDYRKPVPIEQAVELRAREVEFSARKSVVRCTVSSRRIVCAEGEVVAVLVAAPEPRSASKAAQPQVS